MVGAGFGAGFAVEEAGGEVLVFGGGDGVEGFLAAEFHRYGVRVGKIGEKSTSYGKKNY